MTRRLLALLALGLAGAAAPAAALAAGEARSLMRVSATVEDRCRVEAAALDFGALDPAAGASASANVAVQCTPGTGWSLAVAGAGRMAGPAGAGLDYSLAVDPAGGAGAGLAGIGTGQAEPHAIHGSVPAGQADAPPGVYTDLVVVTISY